LTLFLDANRGPLRSKALSVKPERDEFSDEFRMTRRRAPACLLLGHDRANASRLSALQGTPFFENALKRPLQHCQIGPHAALGVRAQG
jgi:hypothetical protein